MATLPFKANSKHTVCNNPIQHLMPFRPSFITRTIKKLFFILFLVALLTQVVMAKDESAKSSTRAVAVCPEISKLAEAIALARDNHLTAQETIDYITVAVDGKPQEKVLVAQLVQLVYERPELTPYEHSKKAREACFEGFEGNN